MGGEVLTERVGFELLVVMAATAKLPIPGIPDAIGMAPMEVVVAFAPVVMRGLMALLKAVKVVVANTRVSAASLVLVAVTETAPDVVVAVVGGQEPQEEGSRTVGALAGGPKEEPSEYLSEVRNFRTEFRKARLVSQKFHNIFQLIVAWSKMGAVRFTQCSDNVLLKYSEFQRVRSWRWLRLGVSEYLDLRR